MLSKENEWKWTRGRLCFIGCWQVFFESLKRRTSSERSGDFSLLNLPRKQRIGRRTKKLVILFHTEFMTAKHLTQNSVIDIEVK